MSRNGTLTSKGRSKYLPVPRLRRKEETQTVISIGSVDYTTLFVTILLMLIGVVMIFSASYFKAGTSESLNYDMYFFLRKQGTFVVLGIAVMVFVSNINYRFWMKLSFPIYITANVLLLIVGIMSKVVKGARRWLNIGISIQPAELAKIGIIFFVSYIIYKNKGILKTWKGFFGVLAIVGVTSALDLLGSLSATIIVTFVGIGIIFVASPHIVRFVAFGGAGVGAVAAFIAFFSKDFRMGRVQAWLDPMSDPLNKGYQILQSLYAIASGGIFGLGIGQSRQKSFVPEPHNDIIFSIVCEETGLIGAGFVLLLFGILIWRGLKISLDAPDLFGSLVAVGVILMIACQVVINVAVVTNTIPNTGVTMPFISYGGSSLLVISFLMGVLLSISRYSKS